MTTQPRRGVALHARFDDHESITVFELHEQRGAFEVLLRAEALTAEALQYALSLHERTLPARGGFVGHEGAGHSSSGSSNRASGRRPSSSSRHQNEVAVVLSGGQNVTGQSQKRTRSIRPVSLVIDTRQKPSASIG